MTAGRLGTVFLSHSAREPDHGVTRALAKALAEVGLDVWWDREGFEGGDFFPVEILEGDVPVSVEFEKRVAAAPW